MKGRIGTMQRFALFVGLVSLSVAAGAADAATAPYTAETIESLLKQARDAERPLVPELGARTPAQWRETKSGKAILKSLPEKLKPIPVTTYTRYRAFNRTGVRGPYQGPYFEKRRQLDQATWAVWLGGDDGQIDRVNDLIWNICEETNWVIPAHERGNVVDLMAAETAAQLATIDCLLAEKLPKEIRQRIRAEVKRRIFDPYLARGREFGWHNGHNNWTGVCAGSVGQAFLLLEPDVGRQARGLETAIEQINLYFEHAFESDGSSTEGVGYWNYGLAHAVILAEMLRAYTDGAIDLLANPKVKKIAAFPAAVAIDKHRFASFSDSHESGTIPPFIAVKLTERTGVDGLIAHIGNPTSNRFGWELRNLLWVPSVPQADPVFEDVVLPEAGIVKRVRRVGDKRMVLVAKAGHNAEAHNQNDVGTFILRIGKTTFLCDPGAGLYSREYFAGATRYENVFCSSYGHSVPRVGGTVQPRGRQHRGELVDVGDNAFTMRIGKAYAVESLRDIERSFALAADGTVTMTDQFSFEGAGRPVEEAFMTWQEAAVDGAQARIRGEDGVLVIEADHGAFTLERLEKQCKANHKKGVLTRLTVTYPAAAATTAKFTMRYVVAKY
jgi:hypothetical protein